MSVKEASENRRAEGRECPRGPASEKMPVYCDWEHLEPGTVGMWWGRRGNEISVSTTQINHRGNRHLRKEFL